MELDWQSKFHEIKQRGLYLMQSEKWSDCHFLVGAPPNQRLLAGHQLVLAMASPVFERMFYGDLAEKSDPILIPDVDPDAFYAMLEYIYSDRINISSFDKACDLYHVANKYMLPHVVEHCSRFLLAALSRQNACRAYELANLFDDSQLMKSSMKIIVENTREILADPSFTDIEVSTLMAILDQDQLNIDSELDLFNALLKYATEHGLFSDDEANAVPQSNAGQLHKKEAPVHVEPMQDRGEVKEIKKADSGRERSAWPNSALTNDMNSSMDPQRVVMDKVMLRQALKKIRFLTLTPQQFAGGPARSKLLQQHEAHAILMNLCSPNLNDCPLPEGLCSSRCSRVYSQRNVLPKTSAHYNSSNEFILRCPKSTNMFYTSLTTRRTIDSLTFEVSHDVCVKGVLVPTQYFGSNHYYTEELCAQIQNMQDTILTYTRCMPTVAYKSEFNIVFNDGVRILANQKYKLFVIFLKEGMYRFYKLVNSSVCINDVTINLSESDQGGLIRGIVFSHS